ncbi:MAG TPA: RNA methyltransferase [Deferrisomatales bacterium]|nr:RNA methyltransferase [Deferrisomatales bacterium]
MDPSYEFLREALRPERWQRLQQVLDSRLGAVRVVVENVHDPHNLSAVLRSAEALGVQHVHVVEAASGFGISRRITRGAHKWLTVHRHQEFGECAGELRDAGFRLYAAMLQPGAVPLDAVPVGDPVALVLGNEHAGVSAEAVEGCDGCYTIPMTGFVQSFNISVAAAVSLYSVTTRARALRADGGRLSEPERQAVLESWLPKSLRCGRRVVRTGRGRLGP